MHYLVYLEWVLFWGGLIVFLASLAMYAFRSKDFKSLIIFWQPTVAFNLVELKINRTGIAMMIAGILVRFAIHFLV